MGAAGSIVRWVHILAGAAWLGAVVMVVFVLVPAVHRLDGSRRDQAVAAIFPRVFRLASVLSVTVLVAGIATYMAKLEWSWHWRPLVTGRWGLSILIGGALAIALTLFHFFAEGILAPHVKGGTREPVDPRVLRILRIAPRVGLVILVAVFVTMMYAAHSF